MAERISAAMLLRQARTIFNDSGNGLASSAAVAWRGGFASGGAWMKMTITILRGTAPIGAGADLQTLGLAKYAMAGGLAGLALGAGILLDSPAVVALSPILFYAIEAQMVFLFPLALDGRPRVFRESRCWTRRAGGTFAVMCVVIPLAATMVFGGFFGRGFVRSWCLGCIAVCAWYEALRAREAGAVRDSTH